MTATPLLLLFTVQFIRVVESSCFTQNVDVMAARPLLTESQTATEVDCESACTANVKCDAYAYIVTRCELLGARVAEAQLWERNADCVTGAPPSTEATTVATTTTTQSTLPTTT
ncbi:hypothetical protein PFISCL1PPCAC_17651, partial [Pristionchus fissidentatus]